MALNRRTDRYAAKFVASFIRECLDDDLLVSPVVHLCKLNETEGERLKRRLAVMAYRLERDAKLPERMIDWKDAK